MMPRVPIGPATVTGYLTAAGAGIAAALVALTGTEAQLAGPGKWLALLAAGVLAATNAGRQHQAAAAARSEAPPPGARPQSATTPDGAAATSEGQPV